MFVRNCATWRYVRWTHVETMTSTHTYTYGVAYNQWNMMIAAMAAEAAAVASTAFYHFKHFPACLLFLPHRRVSVLLTHSIFLWLMSIFHAFPACMYVYLNIDKRYGRAMLVLCYAYSSPLLVTNENITYRKYLAYFYALFSIYFSLLLTSLFIIRKQ